MKELVEQRMSWNHTHTQEWDEAPCIWPLIDMLSTDNITYHMYALIRTSRLPTPSVSTLLVTIQRARSFETGAAVLRSFHFRTEPNTEVFLCYVHDQHGPHAHMETTTLKSNFHVQAIICAAVKSSVHVMNVLEMVFPVQASCNGSTVWADHYKVRSLSAGNAKSRPPWWRQQGRQTTTPSTSSHRIRLAAMCKSQMTFLGPAVLFVGTAQAIRSVMQ